MLTNITFTAQQTANRVVQTRPGLLRIASASNGVLGTVKAEGVALGASVSWSLLGNLGAAVTISAQAGDPTQADISFSQVPVQAEPYLLIIQASTQDGKQVQIPLALVVREAFAIREVTRLSAGEFQVSGHTYDPTVQVLTFKGYGPIGEVPGVKFIPPADLPSGLQFAVDGNDTAFLSVTQPTRLDPSGGMKVGAGTYTVTVKAYREGTLYDTPDTATSLRITYDLTAGPALGALAFEVGGTYDAVGHGVSLEASLAYLNGQAQVHSLEWLVSAGAVGAWAVQPTSTTRAALWRPSGTTPQDVTFTVNVKNAQGSVIATSTVGPFKVCGRDVAAAPDSNWSASSAAPVIVYPGPLYPQEAGKRVYCRVSVPDLLAGETATVSPALVPVGTAPVITDGPSAITLTNASTETVFGFTLPPSAPLYSMWKFQVAVAITGGSSPRSGFAQILVCSKGATPLVLQLADTTLSGNTGSYLSPVTLRAYQWLQNALPSTSGDDYLNPEAGIWNSTLTEVLGVSFQGLSAPAGITPAYQGTSGLYQLTGLVESVGTTTFAMTATKSGFAEASPVSVSLLGQQSVSRLRFTDFSSTNPVVAGGQGFTLTWGYEGSGVLTLQKGNALPPEAVTGAVSASVSPITTSTAYILHGTNSLGEAFSAPVLVQLGATGSSTQLPPSPTIAVLDGANHLTVAWQPSLINGSFSAYHHWVLSVKDTPNGTSFDLGRPGVLLNPTWVDGLSFGGTQDARRFESDLGSGSYHELSMQAFADSAQSTTLSSKPWDTYKAFPAPRSLTLDKSTASKGEAVTITMGEAASGAGLPGDRWWVVYPDGTTSEQFPMTITSVAKAFSQGGASQTITLVVESDFSSAFPHVKLRRTATQSIFIQDQDYQGATGLFDVGGSPIGVGGEAGFEVTDNSEGAGATQPYLVAVPALVRDDLTNELKLLVATTRGRDASSLLGTMAIDVFPLPGRPHTLDLVKLPETLVVSEGTAYDPVKITQDALPDVIVGRNMSPVRLSASRGKAPYRWFSGELPYGLSLSVDGTLSGTVTKLGRFPISLSVQDAQNPSSIANTTLYLTAKSDLSIKTASLASAQVGSAFSQTLEAQQGVQPYTWDLMAGTLPHGLTLGVDGSITGWPVAYREDDFTDYTVVLQATDAVGAKASKQFQITLTPMPLALKDPDQPVLVAGVGYVLRLPIVGGRPGYSLVGQPSAPTGFLASPASIVNGAVELQVSEAFSATGSVSLGITVRDAAATEVSHSATLNVLQGIPVTRWVASQVPARIASASTPSTIQTGGTVTGTTLDQIEVLPSLVNLSSAPDLAQGQVRVMPPVVQGGNEEVTLRVTLKQGTITLGKISREFSVQTVSGTSTQDWTVKALPVRSGDFFVLDPFAPAFNAAPAPILAPNTMRVKATSQLPAGVSLDSVTGHLYGTLRASSAPRSVLEVVDGSDTVVSTVGVDWTIVGNSIQIQGTLPPVAVGQAYTGALAVAGAGAGPTVELLHGRIPEGLSLGYASSQVTLTGRPKEAGYFDLFIRVRDASGQSGLYTSRLVVNYLPYLAVASTAIPKITAGFNYTYPLQATGGAPGYTWAVAQGSTLPGGMTLTSSTGVLTGKSTDTGFSSPVVFEVTDAYGQVARASLNVAVGAADPLVVTTSSLPAGVVGAPYLGVQLQATGGVPTFTWAPVTLPGGMTLDGTTGILTGTPTAPFDQDIAFTVTDTLGITSTKTLRLTIAATTGFRVSTDALPQGKATQAYNPTGGAAAALQVAAASPTGRVAGNFLKVTYQGKLYVVSIGGIGSWSPRVATSLVTDPLHAGSQIPEPATPTPVKFFDPDVVMNGARVGAWADAAQAWRLQFASQAGYSMHPNNVLGRMFAACVQPSANTFVLIGGAHTMNDGHISGTQGRSMHPGLRTDASDGPLNSEYAPIVFATVSLTASGVVVTLAPCRSLPWGSYGFHAACATVLQDGRVFFAGGVSLSTASVTVNTTAGSTNGVQSQQDPNYPTKAAYIMTGTGPAATIARVADLPVSQLLCAQAVTLKDGRVLVIGGLTPNGQGGLVPTANCLLYTPGSNTWAAGPALPSAEYGHSAVVLSDGRVVVGGDRNESGAVATPFYILDPAATQWMTLVQHDGYLPNAWGGMAALPDDTVFYAGGTENAAYLFSDKSILAPSGVTYLDGYNPNTVGGAAQTYYTGMQFFQQAEFSKNYPIAPLAGCWGSAFITPGSVNGGAQGFQLQAAGGVQPYSGWAMTPAITGLTLNPLTGLLSGIPADGFDDTVTFTVRDSTAPAASGPLTATKPLHLTLLDPEAPVWVTPSLPQGKLAQAYSTTLAAKDALGSNLSGNFTISPHSAFGLPDGITLDTNGLLHGTTNTGWSRKVTLRVTHPSNSTHFADREFLLEFVCGTQIDTTTPPDATAGVAYDTTLQCSGGRAPYTWALTSGSLPSGVALDPATGRVSGPCSETGARQVVATITVTDANKCTDTRDLTFIVRNVAWTISPAALSVTRGQVVDLQLQVSGSNGSNTWSVQGLPPGFNLNPTTGKITSATNITTAVGAYPLQVKVADTTGASVSTTVTLTVADPGHTWQSAPNYELGVYSSDPLTLGLAWARDPVSKHGGRNVSSFSSGGGGLADTGTYKGDPWAFVVSGIGGSNPPMAITDTTDPRLKFTATFVEITQGVGLWVIQLDTANSDAAAIAAWAGTHTLHARLNDGGIVDERDLKVLFEPLSGTLMPSGETLQDSAGVAPPYTYYDYNFLYK